MTQPALFDPALPTSGAAPDYKRDPFGWNIWYLEQNPQLYREFRRRADGHVRAGKVVRANRVIQELRFDTLLTGSDAYKINDHASGLFARLYRYERPHATVEIQKKGHWKHLEPSTWTRIVAASLAQPVVTPKAKERAYASSIEIPRGANAR